MIRRLTLAALLLSALPLCLAGVLTIQATSTDEGVLLLAPTALKQIAFAAVGFIVMMSALAVGYQRLGRFSYLLFVLGLGLLALLLVDRWIDLPFVPVRRNARRWIRIGPTQIQPSEIMKIAYVLALAWYLRYRRNYRTLTGLIAPFALTLVPMLSARL